jgi:hypothetical protein
MAVVEQSYDNLTTNTSDINPSEVLSLYPEDNENTSRYELIKIIKELRNINLKQKNIIEDFEISYQSSLSSEDDKVAQIINKESKAKTMKKVMYHHYSKLVVANPEMINTNPLFLQMADEYRRNINSINNKFPIKDFPICFITLNAPIQLHDVKVDWNIIKHFVDKFIKKSYITDAIWTYEQRGITIDDVKGYHAHILINRDNKSQYMEQSKLTRAINIHFNKLWEKNPDFKQLNIKYRKLEDTQDYVNYCHGIKVKNSYDKHKKVLIDRLLRNKEEYKLQDIYKKGELFDKYIAITDELLK